MSASLFRRGGLALLDDAVDRVRGDFFAFALLQVLPSLPFFAGTLLWFVHTDLRGAVPEGEGDWLPLFLAPKVVGWGALSAWAAAGARGRPCSVGAAYLTSLRRLPEVALMSGVYLLAVIAGTFSLVGFVGVPVAFTGLASAVADTRASGFSGLRRGLGASTEDLGFSFVILVVTALAWLFLVVNIVLLPALLLLFGAGSLGVDLSQAGAALAPDRSATWALAGLCAWMLLEGVQVVAFAELQRDREAEREGSRFDAFATELESRAAQSARPARERVA